MRIISGVVPGASRLASISELSKKARQRLKWFDYYHSHGGDARLTCRYFGISPQTLEEALQPQAFREPWGAFPPAQALKGSLPIQLSRLRQCSD